MQIIGIKLKDYGSSGMEITYRRYRKFTSTYATAIDGGEKYKIPIPVHIKARIGSLKYYLMYLMKMWDDSWDKYLTDDLAAIKTETQLKKIEDFDEEEYDEAKDIFDSINFESYHLDKGGFVLSGDIQILHGKYVKVKTPAIVQDDDFTLFNDCLDLIEEINEMISSYFSQPELNLENVKEALKMLGGPQSREEIESMDEDESYEQLVKKLEAKGGIVIIEEGSDLEKEINSGMVIASTNTVRQGKIDPHEEVKNKEGADHDIDKDDPTEYTDNNSKDVDEEDNDNVSEDKKEDEEMF